MVVFAGGSASGKSTLAAAVRERLDASTETVAMDAYMRVEDPEAPRFFFRHKGEAMFDFNHPESVDNAAVLKRIAESEAEIVLVEGLMALHLPEVRNQADLRLFVELEADVRAARRIERNLRAGRNGGDVGFIAAYYVESARVGHARYVEPSRVYADLIVRGDSDLDRTAPLLARAIETERRRETKS